MRLWLARRPFKGLASVTFGPIRFSSFPGLHGQSGHGIHCSGRLSHSKHHHTYTVTDYVNGLGSEFKKASSRSSRAISDARPKAYSSWRGRICRRKQNIRYPTASGMQPFKSVDFHSHLGHDVILEFDRYREAWPRNNGNIALDSHIRTLRKGMSLSIMARSRLGSSWVVSGILGVYLSGASDK